MGSNVDTLRRIRELATDALGGETDPLIAAREIDVHATAIGLGFEQPFVILKGIVSQADEIPDPEQLRVWDSTSAAAKHEERRAFLEQFGDQILSACREIQAFVSRQGG